MSRQKPSGQAQELAARGGEPNPDCLTVVLGKVAEPPPPEPPIAELIARFQLDTEALIGSMRQSHQSQLAEQDRKIALLTDNWERTRAEFSELRTRIEAAVHEMTQGVKEAVNAQKEAVKHAQGAAASVAVFDKLKASQPDFHRMVRDLDVKIAGAIDKTRHVEELVTVLSQRLDDFEVVTTDYEETKGQVRSIDGIVKNLNAENTRRRTERIL